MFRFFLTSIAIVMTGCAMSFQRLNIDEVISEPPRYVEDVVVRYFDGYLKDPESARIQITKPFKAYGNAGLAHGGHVTWKGWAVQARVNAKNSFGAYTGWSIYTFAFDGNDPRKVFKGHSHPLFHPLETPSKFNQIRSTKRVANPPQEKIPDNQPLSKTQWQEQQLQFL